jgi:hypothetical protein
VGIFRSVNSSFDIVPPEVLNISAFRPTAVMKLATVLQAATALQALVQRVLLPARRLIAETLKRTVCGLTAC